LNLVLLKQCSIVGVAWGMWAMQHPEAHAANMEKLLAMHAEGKLAPEITHTYSLEESAQALRDLDARAVRGKVIIAPGS
jgi:NADPH2:quinone reductase